MAEQAQSAAIAQNTRMVNAEASSLKFAAYAASALPYALMTLTGILAYIGNETSAAIAGVAAAAGIAPQLLNAIRSKR